MTNFALNLAILLILTFIIVALGLTWFKLNSIIIVTLRILSKARRSTLAANWLISASCVTIVTRWLSLGVRLLLMSVVKVFISFLGFRNGTEMSDLRQRLLCFWHHTISVVVWEAQPCAFHGGLTWGRQSWMPWRSHGEGTLDQLAREWWQLAFISQAHFIVT